MKTKSLTMKDPINKFDLEAKRREYIFETPSFLLSQLVPLLEDKRDIVMLHLVWNVIVIVFSTALLQFQLSNIVGLMFDESQETTLFFMKNIFPHILGFSLLIMNYALFARRFMLTLHFSSHRRLFKRNYPILNSFIMYVLCPFFGLPSGVYYLHHVIMHHVENNLFPFDLSSTMVYQRNSVVDYSKYFAKYVFAIWVQLPYYAYLRKRYWLFVQTIILFVFYWTCIWKLFSISSSATIWVFLMSFLLSSFLLTFGNWCQHILVDPARPDNSFALSFTIINSPMNQESYNDGYHVIHHVNSKLHWSEQPAYFIENLDRFKDSDSIIFNNIEYMEVGYHLFTEKYDELFKYFVDLQEPKRSKAEVIAMFKKYLEPIDPTPYYK